MAEATVKLGMDTGGFDAGVAKATQSVGKLEDVSIKASVKMAAAQRVTNEVIDKASALMQASIKAAADALAKLTTQADGVNAVAAQFERLYASADSAAKTIKSVRDLSSQMHIDDRDAVKLSSALADAGVQADQLALAVGVLANISAGSGVTIADLGDVYSRTFRTGSLAVADLNALTAAGIPVQEALAKSLHTSFDAVVGEAAKGKVSADAFVKALQAVGSVGGAFGGASAAALDTFDGKLRKIGDTVSSMLASVIRPFADTLKPLLGGLGDAAAADGLTAAGQKAVAAADKIKGAKNALASAQGGNRLNRDQGWADTRQVGEAKANLADAMAQAATPIEKLKDALKPVVDVLFSTVQAMRPAVEFIAERISKMISVLSSGPSMMDGLKSKLSPLAEFMKNLPSYAEGFSLRVAAGVDYFAEKIEQGTFWKTIGEILKGVFLDAVEALKAKLLPVAGDVGAAIRIAFDSLKEVLRAVMGSAVDFFTDPEPFKALGKFLSGMFTAVADHLKSAMASIGDSLKKVLLGSLPAISAAFSVMLDDIYERFQKAHPWIAKAASATGLIDRKPVSFEEHRAEAEKSLAKKIGSQSGEKNSDKPTPSMAEKIEALAKSLGDAGASITSAAAERLKGGEELLNRSLESIKARVEKMLSKGSGEGTEKPKDKENSKPQEKPPGERESALKSILDRIKGIQAEEKKPQEGAKTLSSPKTQTTEWLRGSKQAQMKQEGESLKDKLRSKGVSDEEIKTQLAKVSPASMAVGGPVSSAARIGSGVAAGPRISVSPMVAEQRRTNQILSQWLTKMESPGSDKRERNAKLNARVTLAN